MIDKTIFQSNADRIKENEPLSLHTYMKVGGPADLLIDATSTTELTSLIDSATNAHIPIYVMGGGSNTLFTDKGFRGLVIINRSSSSTINADSGLVEVDSGLATNALVNQVITAGLGGLAPFLGIPGSIGGAVYNNSHYLDQLIGNYVTQCTVYDPVSGVKTMNHDDLHFSYDYSILQEMSATVLTVTFQLEKSETAIQREIATAALKRRQSSQPLTLPSSGCIFKNFKDQASHYPKIPPPHYLGRSLDRSCRVKGVENGWGRN